MEKNLKRLYREKIVPLMVNNFGYRNSEEVPKIVKISVNRGFGKSAKSQKELKYHLREIALITGQYPRLNKARKPISGFKVRDGMLVGGSVTLRKKKMYAFLTKLIHITLPRIRDFQGIRTSFDGHGNYNIGFKEQLVFPEIRYNDVTTVYGFDVSIVTTAKTDEEAFTLLSEFGLPFMLSKN
jgi:large subunit ribosomal protein L5